MLSSGEHVNRLVLIDGRLIGYRYGGIASYARQLATRAPAFARNECVRVAVRRNDLSLLDRSVRVFTPPHHRLERYAFGAEVMAHRPGLLHSVDYVQPVTPGVKSVATVHDLAFLDNPSLVTPESFSYYSQIEQTLPSADRVIAVSTWTRDRLLYHLDLDSEMIDVVPNGYDPDIFGPYERDDTDALFRLHPDLSGVIRSERPIILAVGTIEPRKRYSILLSGFSDHWTELERLSGTSPILVIAGQPGWLADDTVSTLRLLQRSGRAIWLRDIRDRELAALYRQATLHVMPSADEGFGLPALEAMASGTPSLVANVGALPELVGDCGFIEDSDQPVSWAEKIGRIVADPEIRDRRAQRGIERATPLTWQETARATMEIYRKVLDD